ncbi:MAG: ABC transporter ATP-binding protein [Pirellulaceae bacterium]|nr:ABC transporter ATP-binding protein [Pirellulaceae bacterium]
MIQLTDVSKHFQRADQTVRALDHLTLQIAPGEFVAVRGSSGCGKSTLLSMIGGLALPSSGTVSVSGQDISAMSSTARAAFRSKNVGFVFQMFHLLPYLTVLDNVLVATNNTDTEAATQRATELLEQFSLEDRLLHRPGQLSAGERQRVAMARALLPQPRLLLADEPTGNLDPENAAAVLQLLQQFHEQGGTILLVTHDEQAASHAARTIILSDGKLVEESPATATVSEG